MIFLFFLVPVVVGWGRDGHGIISSLASGIMNEDAVKFLERTLEEDDIGSASIWADTIEAETKYPRSGAYHFSNTPYRKCSAFEFDRDCGFGQNKGICIVTGLADAISRAIDVNVADSVRADALKFILHLMADIHQPLHTGFRADSGGGRIALQEPSNTSLHLIWDNWLIDEMRLRSNVSIETILRRHLEKNDGRFVKGLRAKTNMTEILSSDARIFEFVASLATETATTVTCNAGYKDTKGNWISGNGAVIDAEYYNARQPILIVQLLKASARLGILMEGIAEKLSSQRRSEKDTRRRELFSQVPLVSSSVSANPFEGLYIEFDPDSLEPSEFATVSVPSTKRVPSLAPGVNETDLIEKAVRESENEKGSYIFSGVDISKVRLYLHEGRMIVTNATTLKSYLKTATMYRSVPIQTMTSDGHCKTKFYDFDADTFPRDTPEDVVIRCVLKFSGVDPRIDITEYLGSIRTWKRLGDNVSRLITQHLFLRAMNLCSQEIIATENLFKRVSDLGPKLLYKRLDADSVAFVHIETLRKWSQDHPRIVLAKLPFRLYRSSNSKLVTPTQIALVDLAIINERFDAEYSSRLVWFMIREASRRKQVSTNGHVLWDEIAEISKEYQLQRWAKGSSSDDRKHIQWIFDYEYGMRNATKLQLPIIEGIRKGYFNSTDDFLSNLTASDP